jgi:FixJ family two-component response regulator
MADVQSKIVAIVDDDLHLRESIKDLLETVGYESRLYESGDDFLDKQGYRFASCILADVRMPGISGLELLSILANVKMCPPVIIMTSYADAQTKSAVYRNGAVAFLGKPIDTEQLLACLAGAMS